MVVVLFGFEPFLEYKENPSQIIVRSLDGRRISDHDVKGIVLPVDYGRIENLIVSSLDRERPVLALGLGLAPKRNSITPERIAVNYKFAKEPDNTGKLMMGEQIDQSQPDGLFANLPVEALVSELNRIGIPSSLSLSAGAYLCNNAMFVIIREGRRLGFEGGFIHVPCHSEFVAREGKDLPCLPLQTMQKGIEASIEYLLNRQRGMTPSR
jgi:pyroglutamyl-peptidase